MKNFPLLPRPDKTDKRNYGHTLIVAGSDDMAGAAVLTTRAALISGSGLVTLAVPKSIRPMLLKLLPEALFLEPTLESIEAYVARRGINILAIGPGLTTVPKIARRVRQWVSKIRVPIILDADGLNAFEGRWGLLKKHNGPLILTPHAGEFKRLFGFKMPSQEKERIGLAKKVCKPYHGVLVMKGHRTVVADAHSHYVNRTGNPGLAKGGAGDVLTGILAAFMAQGLEPFQAAKWAVYCHGLAGDEVAARKSQLSVLASDLIEALPGVYKSLSRLRRE